MNNEKMREEFEKCVKSRLKDQEYYQELFDVGDIDLLFVRNYAGDRYKVDWIMFCWELWQASRENIEVELPSEYSGIYSLRDGGFYKVKEVKQKLTEQGVKVNGN